MEIRNLTADDLDEFWPLRLRALREEPASFGATYEEEAAHDAAIAASRLASLSIDRFILGDFDPVLVGVVGFVRETSAKTRHKGVLWGLYVAPEARGRGIARALSIALLDRAGALPGLEQVNLTVTSANEAARALYTSLWFTTFGVEHRALCVEGRYLDLEYMSRRLQ